jgi:outer membrane protein assembly factor BamB
LLAFAPRLALALCAAASLGCDTLSAGAYPEAPLWRYRPSYSMKLVYERSIYARSRQQGEPYQRGRPEIDRAHRRVFVGSSDGGLYALQADTGDILWRFETLGFVQCSPLYDPRENVVYFGSNDGALYKVDAEHGQLLWRFMTNAEVARRPVLDGSTLYAANANDTLIAVDTETGKLRWSQHRTPALGMEVAGYSGPTLYRGRVYMGFSDGTVTAFDAATGAERWQPVDLSAEAEALIGGVPQYLDADTTPIALELEQGPAVFVASYAGGVYALDADTGRQIWSQTDALSVTDLSYYRQAPYPAPPADFPPERAPTELLLAASGTTGLWALDPETGKTVWRRVLPEGGVAAPEPVAGALLTSATRLGVFLISPIDGTLIDGIHLTDGVSAEPAVAGSRAFILTNGGNLLALTVQPPNPTTERSWFDRTF